MLARTLGGSEIVLLRGRESGQPVAFAAHCAHARAGSAIALPSTELLHRERFQHVCRCSIRLRVCQPLRRLTAPGARAIVLETFAIAGKF